MAERKPAARNPGSGGEPRLRKLDGAKVAGSASIDRLIHERLRLAIVSALAVHDSLSFNELKDMIGASDGNLSVHARKLEEAQYVACTKSFDGRTPRTEYRLTAAGRRSLERYLAHMEALIRAVRERP
jgi:DNA-binding HxlR family transcriptional regulator